MDMSHEYVTAGSYAIDLTAVVPSDDPVSTANISYTASASVQVVYDASLSFALTPNGEGAHSDVQAHVSFSDPDGATVSSYIVDWGDGDTEEYGPEYGGVFGHTYTQATAPADLTVRVTAETSEGEFTALQTAAIQPNSPWLGLTDGGYADSGHAYFVEAYFAYDLAGQLATTFPVPNHTPVYTVNWGDGQVDTFDSNQFTHTYVYQDPGTSTNEYVFTVTAATDEYTATASGSVDVLPHGSGQITPASDPGDITEGQAATFFGASFSDSVQDSVSGYGANWTVWWGDGAFDNFTATGNDPPSFVPSHVYNEPGSYAVTFGAGYGEDNGGFDSAHVVYADPFTVSVAEHTPTLSVTTYSNGDYLALSPTYTDTVGDHRTNVLTVNWGDGSQSILEGAGNPPLSVDHIYPGPGMYEPSLSLSAYADDGHITAGAGTITVATPALSIATGENPVAGEYGQSPNQFTITRPDNESDSPLTVPFTLGGTLDPSAYVVTDGDRHVLSGSVTFPAGADSALINVYPLEDHTPRWTETVDITLTPGDGYTLGSKSAAGCYVTSDDLYAWLDNGSNNDVFEGGSPSDGGTLIPLVLDVPEEQRNGAQITLTDNAPTEADVYTVSNPGPDDQPILGDVNGTPVSDYTWTEGSDDTAPHGEVTLWVEAISGSASLNDILFEVYGSDANCGDPGTGSDPTLPQQSAGEYTYATTTVSGPSNGATAVKLAIIEKNDPNGAGKQGTDISVGGNDIQTWLVGQMVDLEAEVEGPTGFAVPLYNYTWANPPGNTARAWTVTTGGPSGGTASTIPLTNDDGGAISGDRTGLGDQELAFYWVAKAGNGYYDDDAVSVTASGDGQIFHSSTTFLLYAPTVSAASINIGQAGLNSRGTAAGLISGFHFAGYSLGMVAQATVSNAPGVFNFLQLDQLTQTEKNGITGVNRKSPYPADQPGLDVGWPIDDSYLRLDRFNAVASVPGAPSGLNGWSTGSVNHIFYDGPSTPLGLLTGFSSNEAFTDYIMYLPPGAWSQWVPLDVGHWGYRLAADRKKVTDDNWTFLNGGAPGPQAQYGDDLADQFKPASAEPHWSFVVINGKSNWVNG